MVINKHHLRNLLGFTLVAVFLLHVIGMIRIDAVDALERRAYDVRLKATIPGGIDDRIVIADIDERSLEALGHWPWSRAVLAEMVDTLFNHYGVRTIGFDVIFAEPDRGSGLALLDELAKGPLKGNAGFQTEFRRRAPQLDYDNRFAQSLAGKDVVLGFVFGRDPSVARNPLPEALIELPPDLANALPFHRPTGHVAPLAELQEAGVQTGYFDNPSVDDDGIFRRVPLFQLSERGLHPSLSLAAAWLALGKPPLELNVEETGGYMAIEGVTLGDRQAPVDAQTNVLVPYRGPKGSFPYLSIVDILERKVPVEQLADRIVLVGTSAPGLLDLRTTPLERAYPGVEVHANVIAGILDNSIRGQPAWTLGVEFLLVLSLGLLMLLVTARLGPVRQFLLSVFLVAATIAVNLAGWSAGHIIPLASSLSMIIVLFIYLMSYGYFVEARGKRELGKLFGQYVPPELVEEMSANPGAITMEGQAKELTVLFSDVRGFTSISEGLDPRELSDLMNTYLTAMTRVIHQHRGTIDKYMGDAIMAFWGAPLADPDHARHAMEAAMDMVRELENLQAVFHERGWQPIRIGIGLNTGIMNVGNMGSEFRMAYTVMGDAVNLGSRLEGLSKQYGVTLVVSEYTRNAVPDYVYRRLDRVRVKGKDQPVLILEPAGPQEQVSDLVRTNIERFHQALDAYAVRDWDQAEELLQQLIARGDDRKVYHLYLDRIAHFREEPPPADWDGVFTHETK